MLQDLLDKLKEFIGIKTLMGGIGTASILGYFLFVQYSSKKHIKQSKKLSKSRSKSYLSLEKYIELLNAREQVLFGEEKMKEIVEKEDNLISKVYYAEKLINQRKTEMGDKIFNEILSSTSKDPYDIFAVARAHFVLGKKKQALEFYLKATDCPFTYSHIGVIHQEGIEVEKNLNKAKEYYLLGAKNSDPISLYMLAILALNEKNFTEGQEYLNKASKLNFIPVLVFLKEYYHQTNNEEQFILVMTKLYDLKHEQTMLEHAMMSFQINPQNALVNIRLLADNGMIKAQGVLIDIISETNPSEAYKIGLYYLSLKRSAELLFTLGMFSEEGRGCEKDIVKAYEYMKEASEMGHINAMFIYGYALIEGNEEAKINQYKEKGLELLRICAQNDHIPAQEYFEEISNKNVR